MRKLDARNRGLVWTLDAWRISGKWIARTSTLADPFPSHHVDAELVEIFGDDNPDAYIRWKKIGALAQHLLVHELLAGNLVANFLKDKQTRPIPTWAWINPHRTKFAWSEGRLPLDVRLPDEWQQWNCCESALDRKQFGRWVQKELPSLVASTVEIPDLARIEQGMPALVKTRLPSDRPWVELSEALTWIAFDIAMSLGRLHHAADSSELGLSSQEVEVKLSESLIRLADLAAGGNIGLRGKWTDGDAFEGKLTEAIPQQRFHDFRRYDILRDGLGFGNGYNPHEPLAFLDTSKGQYFDVTVNRGELLKAFPPSLFVGSEEKIKTSIKGENDCVQWLTQELNLHDPKLKPKSQFKAEAMKKFPNLGERGFSRAWAAVTKERPEWKMSGAKKKSKH